ncbi:hypothetical protein PHYSODRAFT_293433 [Phytophthora sojae]|uniref:PH domain-containing protein n=1 Tax=Phytophthora sojae (strain P6497) TaxID=1094619 RepID=G4YFT2_PHYSP|nr:hypothetical protein PHYSODRAFT_293433 [Phytophthora sojae]EGZ27659.1 hypothetical protein PHYSODRAFT_293433 [Phytophthora sojae]|eukprot:XP_009514934.1 hypothetical protein PHYSODRAFT_293433 [Phytophthora sojae]
MTCGKFHVQSCSLIWFLSTIYLVRTALPKRNTEAAFNLVIQRPRVAGGTLTIPLDSTVKIVNDIGSDTARNIIRLEHGSSCKRLVMRASSSVEHERWLYAIATATTQFVEHTTTCDSFDTSERHRAKNSQPAVTTQQPAQHATRSQASHVAPANSSCSLGRMLRQNVPNVMQFFTTVGQIIAAAT